jgi:elongator complex protein 1
VSDPPYHLCLLQQPLHRSKFDSDAVEVVLEPGDSLVAMDYLMERESLLLGSSSGCLILYSVEEKATQIVGRLEGGVSTIASSPDGALISVTTGFGQLLLITQDWEVLSETSLDPQVRVFLSIKRYLLKVRSRILTIFSDFYCR